MTARAGRSVLTVGGLSRWAPASQSPTPSLEGHSPRQGPRCSSARKHVGCLPSTAVLSDLFTLWQSSQGKQLSRGRRLLLLGQARERKRTWGLWHWISGDPGSYPGRDFLPTPTPPLPQGVHTCRYPPPARWVRPHQMSWGWGRSQRDSECEAFSCRP